jgi:hypothetical protein
VTHLAVPTMELTSGMQQEAMVGRVSKGYLKDRSVFGSGADSHRASKVMLHLVRDRVDEGDSGRPLCTFHLLLKSIKVGVHLQQDVFYHQDEVPRLFLVDDGTSDHLPESLLNFSPRELCTLPFCGTILKSLRWCRSMRVLDERGRASKVRRESIGVLCQH